jgi:hypothetical protein
VTGLSSYSDRRFFLGLLRRRVVGLVLALAALDAFECAIQERAYLVGWLSAQPERGQLPIPSGGMYGCSAAAMVM